MKKNLDWKNILGAAFFVAAILGSGIAKSDELSSASDPKANMVCSCARSAFNDPNCSVLKNQIFDTGGVNRSNPGHGNGAVMPQSPAESVSATVPGNKS